MIILDFDFFVSVGKGLLYGNISGVYWDKL